MSQFQFDQFDAGIVSERQRARYYLDGIQVGDFIKRKDGMRARVTHVWDDGAQTTRFCETGEGGSFHFGAGGGMSYSGSLEPSLPKTHLKDTGNYEKARAWIFHHGSSGGGRGVDCEALVKVWAVLDDSEAVDDSKPSRWIINPESSYNAGGQSYTYTTFDGVEHVAYTGKTLTDYLLENPTYFVLSDAEFSDRLKAYHTGHVTKPKATTEARFYEMLEVLPPCRWGKVQGVEMFHVSERITGNIVSWFGCIDKTYYEFADKADRSGEELAAEIAAVHNAAQQK